MRNFIWIMAIIGIFTAVISFVSAANPTSTWVAPTPDDGNITATGTAIMNASIIKGTNTIENINWTWNNLNYSFYNDDLVLMMNLDSNSIIGESPSCMAGHNDNGDGTCTATYTVASSLDDTYDQYQNGVSKVHNPTSVQVRFGKFIYLTINIDNIGYMRYSIDLPKNTLVTEAHLSVTAAGSSGAFTSQIKLLDTDNQIEFSTGNYASSSNLRAISTWGSVAWTPATWTNDVVYTSSDISILLNQYLSKSNYDVNDYIGIKVDYGNAVYAQTDYRWFDSKDGNVPSQLMVTYSKFKAVDVSSSSNNGTSVGGREPNWVSGGKYGYGLDFDAGNDDYIQILDSAELRLTTQGTIMMWVKGSTTSQENTATLITKDKGLTAATSSYNMHWREVAGGCGANKISAAITDGSDWDVVCANEPDTNWHHWTFMWDGSDLYLYKDGVQVGTASQTLNAQAQADQNIKIGGALGGGGDLRSFDGIIDEVRIYDRSLSVTEIIHHNRSNLYKYTNTNWAFYTGQPVVANGNYTYRVCTYDSLNNKGCTVQNRLNYPCMWKDNTDWVLTETCKPTINVDIGTGLLNLDGGKLIIDDKDLTCSGYVINDTSEVNPFEISCAGGCELIWTG